MERVMIQQDVASRRQSWQKRFATIRDNNENRVVSEIENYLKMFKTYEYVFAGP